MTIHDSLQKILEHRDSAAALFYEVFFDRSELLAAIAEAEVGAE